MPIRLSVITLISLTLILSGVIFMGENRGHTMSRTELHGAANAAIPPIDKDMPEIIETATFALG